MPRPFQALAFEGEPGPVSFQRRALDASFRSRDATFRLGQYDLFVEEVIDCPCAHKLGVSLIKPSFVLISQLLAFVRKLFPFVRKGLAFVSETLTFITYLIPQVRPGHFVAVLS